MKVSLIVPVFNVSSYLPRLMETVLSQTYREIEIILIDDGSSDSSGEICDKYQLQDDRIKTFHTPNKSAADARNTGIDVSTGDYIVFADGDDYLANDYVEYLLRLCTENNADMSCCAWSTDFNGSIKKCSYRKNEQGLYLGNHEAMRALLTTRLMSSSVWGKMFKRKLFDGIRFPEGSNYYEDEATIYRLVAKADSVAVGDESKYFYVMRNESLTHRSFDDNNLKIIKVFEERCSFIEENYPELTLFARSDVLMVVNHCVIKLSSEKLYDHPAINGLKSYYKRYEKYFLKGISYLPAKLFSLVAFVNIRLAMRLYRLSGKRI